MDSCETRVCENLYKRALLMNFVTILSWNPPNAKSYRAPNLKLPWLDGQRRRRDSLDAIWVIEECLFLVELKCFSSESGKDVEKLRRIRDRLGLEQIVTFLRRQGVEIGKGVTQLVLTIGVNKVDTPIPADFIVLEVTNEGISPFFGAQVTGQAQEKTNRFCHSI